MSNETRQPAGVPTGGQFAATTHAEGAVALAVDTKPVHEFDSTGEAYDQTQCDDTIHDGDVLAIPSEGVYGFLYQAWPIAVTEQHGDLHSANLEGLLADNPQYVAAADQAKALARAAAHI